MKIQAAYFPGRYRMNRMLRTTLVLTLLVALARPLASQDRPQVVRFGVVVDGPSGRNDFWKSTFTREIGDLLSGQFDPQFPAEIELVADWTRAGVEAALERLLADPSVDIVITMGVIASEAAARRAGLPKPVVAPFVLDAGLQRLPMTNGTSGVENLTYISIPTTFARDIQALREVVDYGDLAILANQPYLEAIPELGQAIEAGVVAEGVVGTVIPVYASAEEALAAIPDAADAVYVGVLTQFSDAELLELADGLIARNLPSYTAFGEEAVRNGFLMSINPADFWMRIARRTALNIQRILLGENPSELPVTFTRSERLTLNRRTARAIGVSPPWAVLTEAVVFDPERTDVERVVSLAGVAQEAVDRNLDLLAQGYFVSSGEQRVRGARSILFPQIDVGATASTIDVDRAEASFGNQAQSTLIGSATFSQIIVSEPAWANLSIEGHLQDSREEELERVRLDVILAASVAYLDVLRAQTIERIQDANLGVTRQNLELAVVRQDVGVASAGEVARWESEIATARQDVIDANAARNVFEIELNRVLNRPLEDPFQTLEVTAEDVDVIANDAQVLRFLRDPGSFRILRNFLAQEALDGSPELKQVDALIAAQERVLTSASNRFWVPEVALFAGLDGILAEDGAGVGSSVPGTPILFPQTDDVAWTVGLELSYPLFTGLGRAADKSRASFELDDLVTQRAATAQRVEQFLRSVLHETGASFAGIELSRDAAAAARRNLELVTDSYGLGRASVVVLIDAQNQSLVAELGVANSAYDFLIDVLRAERAIGRFSFFWTPADRDDFFQRLEAYEQRVRGGN